MGLFVYLGPLPFLPILARGWFLLLAEMFFHELINGLECQRVDFVDVDLNLVGVRLQISVLVSE